MIKKVLIISFIVLWFSNYWICLYLYPNYEIDKLQWGKFNTLREIVFESMFFILLITSIFKPSRETRALILATSVVVGCSIIDKITGVLTYAYSDIIVVAFAVFVGILVYRKNG